MSTFTKKYLIEVIDKRIAELDTPDGSLSADEHLLRQVYEENIISHAKALLEEGRERLERLAEAVTAYDDSPTRDNVTAVKRVSGPVESIDRFLGQTHHYQYVGQIEDRVRKARQKNPANAAHEKRRLEAAKKYVSESPDTEFSLTLMRNLGFLDVIKGALNA